MYTLTWKNPAIDANKAAPITVQVGAVVSDRAPISFSGKGAPNYGVIQQQNLMRLLESFADSVPPLYPTVGLEWYDTSTNTLKVCSSTSPLTWKSLGGIQVTTTGATSPTPAAIGDIWVQKTGSQSGTMYIYTGLGRQPESFPNIGGWSQIYPAVETIAGREEYDYLLTLVNQLIGPSTVGGSGALGNALPALEDLTQLDASLRSKFSTSPDLNVLTPISDVTTELQVDTNSSDWDLLLAAAKFAVNRLDLPAGMVSDISPMPFVSDGQQVPTTLTNLATTDVRYPTLERRSNKRFGLVTLIRAFTETANVLSTAVSNRYSIKGINGSTGANATFGATTEVVTHKSISGNPAGVASGSVAMKFNFASTDAMNSFLNAGGAIQMTLSYNPGTSPSAADTAFKTLVDSRGVVRLTADKMRVFANVYPLVMAVAPATTGIWVPGAAVNSSHTISTVTVGTASFTLSSTQGTTSFVVTLDLNTAGPLNGTMAVLYEVIRDNTQTYVAPIVNAFGAPLAFAAGDKTGATFLN